MNATVRDVMTASVVAVRVRRRLRTWSPAQVPSSAGSRGAKPAARRRELRIPEAGPRY